MNDLWVVAFVVGVIWLHFRALDREKLEGYRTALDHVDDELRRRLRVFPSSQGYLGAREVIRELRAEASAPKPGRKR